jgi:hypothetical protein
MEERDDYETMGKASRLYIKKIRSCSGLLILSIHEHYAWQALVPRFCQVAWRQVTAVTGRPALSAVTPKSIPIIMSEFAGVSFCVFRCKKWPSRWVAEFVGGGLTTYVVNSMHSRRAS